MILLSPPLSLRPNPISSSSLSPLPLSLLINGAPKSHCRARGSRFTVCLATKPLIKDRVLRVNGREALSGVPENVTLSHITTAAARSEGSDSASASASASFLGAVADREDCRHVFKIGVLRDCCLVCLFRFRIFWMIPRFGNSASDIPQETQMLLLEIKEDKSVSNEVDGNSEDPITYILLLPVLDGLFRSSLQGNSSDELEFCIESGDPAVRQSQFLEAVLVNYGNNPFDLMKESMKILEKHKGTFTVREHKKKPAMLDWFGWCTWDAFYFDVNPRGIMDGLKSLCEGGTPPRFLIIDDGWQDTENEFQKEGEPSAEGSQYGARLVSVRENSKFRNISLGPDEEFRSLKDFITGIKKTFGLKYVYVWHALMGYWGGVHWEAPETKKYNSKLVYPIQSPGNLAHLRDLTMDCMEKYGIGMINPDTVFEFYNDYHSYLVSQNVDGVKVDVQNVLETLGSGYGGRVSLTSQFHDALEKSISKNFQDNSIICCMGHNTDSVYSLKVSAITRVSDDYMPRNQASQTLHIAAVAFNSIFLGEVVIPDWDMFYSQHYAAEFHAAARSLGGCGIYISDKPNHHDFELLKKLVLPDGSILRAKYPGRPTRDCLFTDPVMDGKSLLKIWNLNACNGILGIFNCQGAGTWPCLDSSLSNPNSEATTLSAKVRSDDIEYLEEVAANNNWTGDCAVYSFNAGSLTRFPKNKSWSVTLKVLQCVVFTVSPIKAYSQNIQFAPIGLLKMYNSGGAVKAVHFTDDCLVVEGRGCGLFGAYSSREPKSCGLNSEDKDFEFNNGNNLLTLMIPSGVDSWEIEIYF
ncbi:probable galactinol--sucrose galactosyltransferase 2 isoform X1 [Ananas comosus]|uniref:galactinol--sucrose galactosyltransferase n=1 Tax=Ananas comosus TaxID=4615 RepID=A0A6P5GEF6_ANACO|nr:probable galactinol--sucrose galactosyltransferase 2 isoform X1 [Ananas comosus]